MNACPYCGSGKTNRGRLLHYGHYTGFSCRTWIADCGSRQQGIECRAIVAVRNAARPAGKEGKP